MTVEKKKSSKIKMDSLQARLDSLVRDRITPVEESYVVKLAEILLCWVEDEKNITLNRFWSVLPHARSQVYRWANEFPVLATALEMAKCTLAARREEKVVTDPHFTAVYNKTVGCYDHEYRDHILELERYKADCKKDEENKTIRLIMEQMPSTSVVKEKE